MLHVGFIPRMQAGSSSPPHHQAGLWHTASLHHILYSQADFGSWKDGEISTDPCKNGFHPNSLYLEHTNTYLTHTYGIHSQEKPNNKGHKNSFLKYTNAVHTNKHTLSKHDL